MRRLHVVAFCMAVIALLVCIGCDKTGDDTSLPPAERAARFDAFAKEGMDWSELEAKFPPDRYSFSLHEPGNPAKHIGGTAWLDYTPEKFTEARNRTPNHEYFSFQYNWSRRPPFFYEVNVTKDGKVKEIRHTGSME